MSVELSVLALAALLQVVQIALMAVPANLELGVAKTLSPRDPEKLGGSLESQVSVQTGRLYRAMNNHFEALLLFAIAVFVVTASGQSSDFTQWCAGIYLAARVLYIPAYVMAWVPWRSVIWSAGLLATVFMLLSALL